MKLNYLSSATLLLSLTGSAAYAATIDLTATVRDFKESHPDMQNFVSGLKTGMVDSTLAADKKPDYIGTSNYGAVTSTATFDQWYTDVNGVNQSTSLNLILDNEITNDENVYTFSDSTFFPIDNQLFGNEDNSHNYHFTLELNSMFTYQGGETFSFMGDDDLWVFIDDKLAIDLGGVHAAESASVKLDNLGLTIGETYDFDLFFAERHTTQSNFRIDTSIALQSAPPNPVPLPAAAWLFGSAIIGAGIVGRRKKKAA